MRIDPPVLVRSDTVWAARVRPVTRLLAAGLMALCLGACADDSAGKPERRSPFGSLPRQWPVRLEVGLRDNAVNPAELASQGFGFRYTYLSGGVNTGEGWRTWGRGGGSFVADYVAASRTAGLIPVFSYYQLLQSRPAVNQGGSEAERDALNLRTPATMRTYYSDLEAFFRAAAPGLAPPGAPARTPPVVLHVEPDLWGYIQTLARDDAGETVPVSVASSGRADLDGLPDNARGFAQAIVRLRNRFAPRVLLAYHLSPFGSGKDIKLSNPSDEEVAVAATRSARFYRSLSTRFDMLFAEFTNRDEGYSRVVEGDNGAGRWTATDFRHFAQYLDAVGRSVRRRTVLWQIPVGNRVMRSVNDTPGHFQDNKVEWLLGPGFRVRLAPFVSAGVIGTLFGQALPDATCACDARSDGVTNPPPIGSNRRVATSADDDGGYVRERVAAFARARAVRLR